MKSARKITARYSATGMTIVKAIGHEELLCYSPTEHRYYRWTPQLQMLAKYDAPESTHDADVSLQSQLLAITHDRGVSLRSLSESQPETRLIGLEGSHETTCSFVSKSLLAVAIPGATSRVRMYDHNSLQVLWEKCLPCVDGSKLRIDSATRNGSELIIVSWSLGQAVWGHQSFDIEGRVVHENQDLVWQIAPNGEFALVSNENADGALFRVVELSSWNPVVEFARSVLPMSESEIVSSDSVQFLDEQTLVAVSTSGQCCKIGFDGSAGKLFQLDAAGFVLWASTCGPRTLVTCHHELRRETPSGFRTVMKAWGMR